MIAELLGLADTLSKVKDLKDLLVQERLRTMISFLETVGQIQIKTAIEELRAMPYSTQPNGERSRAIGHLKVAANALAAALQKRPFLGRLMGQDAKRQMRTHLQITGCYLIVARLYAVEQNMGLARQYAAQASTAFESYARDRARSSHGRTGPSVHLQWRYRPSSTGEYPRQSAVA